MKSTKLISSLSLAVSAIAIHSGARATQPSAAVGATVSIQNTVAGKFSVGNNGTALSSARNSEAASASVTASANNTPNFSAVNAAVSAATTTDSSGNAFNISTGTGSGSASSTGAASAAAQGAVAIHAVTTSFNGGFANTQTSNAIFAGTNQGSYVAGQTKAGFDVGLHYTQTAATTAAPASTSGIGRSASVSIADQKSGYASGASVSGALDGMNAAGLANIGASGQFFVRAAMAATVGATAGTANDVDHTQHAHSDGGRIDHTDHRAGQHDRSDNFHHKHHADSDEGRSERSEDRDGQHDRPANVHHKHHADRDEGRSERSEDRDEQHDRSDELNHKHHADRDEGRSERSERNERYEHDERNERNERNERADNQAGQHDRAGH